MDKQNFFYIVLLGIIIIGISSCANLKIEKKKFEEFTYINAGEEAVQSWEFENAEKVLIDEIPREFNATDSISVTPKESSRYNFKAMNDEDTLNNVWRVYVKNPDDAPIVGPDTIVTDIRPPSYEESEYLRGILSSKSGSEPYYMKIMRLEYPDPGNYKVKARAVILDRFGNYLSGIEDNNTSQMSITKNCDEDFRTERVNAISEKYYSSSEPSVDIAIVMENSAAAQYNQGVFEQVSTFTKNMDNTDRLSFSIFNQDFSEIFPMNKPEKAIDDINKLTLPLPGGLSSLYKSLFISLLELGNDNSNNDKVLVSIVFGADNSSIIYDLKDLADISRKYKIPVYVIGVGNALETYALKYLCNVSGGKFYYLSDDKQHQVVDILNEILVSQKTYYAFNFDFPQSLNCNMLPTNISWESGSKLLKDNITLYRNAEEKYSKYQSLAAFDEGESSISPVFDIHIKEFAEVLKNNPSFAIQLIGHSGIEGGEKTAYELGMKRAQEVRRKLLDFGVAPSQIRVRSEGSSLPVYYMQEAGWQKYYNRRVDVRWLDPDLLPFEIIAGQMETEKAALNVVEEWESRGLNAYYQRYLKNNDPNYRIKIWGFRTKESAELTARRIEYDYKIKVEIE